MHRDKVTICLGKEKYIRRRLPLQNAPAVKSLRVVMKFSVTITATWHFSVTSCIKTWASDQRWQHDAARGGRSSKTEKKKKIQSFYLLFSAQFLTFPAPVLWTVPEYVNTDFSLKWAFLRNQIQTDSFGLIWISGFIKNRSPRKSLLFLTFNQTS